MRRVRSAFRPLALFMALAVLCCSGNCPALADFVDPDDLSEGRALFLNSRDYVDIEQGGSAHEYIFTPVSSGRYSFRTFPSDESPPSAAADLYRESGDRVGSAVSDAGQLVLDAELEAGEAYRLSLRGTGGAGRLALEVMMEAHGRCIYKPILLGEGNSVYTKKITQPRDTHWYSYTAQHTGLYIIRTETAEQLPFDVQGYVLNESGVELYYNDDLMFPSDTNFLIYAYLEQGESYYIRVSALSNMTGVYRLAVSYSGPGEPPANDITLNFQSLDMSVGGRVPLSVTGAHAGDHGSVVWTSSDFSVAFVSPGGEVTAVSSGKAVISAITPGGVTAECVVEVAPVMADELYFEESSVNIYEGERYKLAPVVSPREARVEYTTSDPDVISIDESGEITAVGIGYATVTVEAVRGDLQATIDITVHERRPVFRALIISEQNYFDGRTRIGAVNTAQGVADALHGASGDGNVYETKIMLDSTIAEVSAAIGELFAGNRDGDVSVIYITCHGGKLGDGTPYFELHDGTRVYPGGLDRMLSGIAGNVVLLLDFCYSGAFIGKSTLPDEFGLGVERAAHDTPATGGLSSGKYYVLTSSSADQDSNRYGYAKTENDMATFFASSLCEGLGWDLFGDARLSLRADLDGDRQVTFQELFYYVRRRMNLHYAGYNSAQAEIDPSHTPVSQTAQAAPTSGTLVVFARERRQGQ